MDTRGRKGVLDGMTIIITIRNSGLSPGVLMGVYAKYLEMRKQCGYDKTEWKEEEG